MPPCILLVNLLQQIDAREACFKIDLSQRQPSGRSTVGSTWPYSLILRRLMTGGLVISRGHATSARFPRGVDQRYCSPLQVGLQPSLEAEWERGSPSSVRYARVSISALPFPLLRGGHGPLPPSLHDRTSRNAPTYQG